MSRPLEVRVAAALLAGAAVLFAGLGALRLSADPGALKFPVGVGAVGLLAALSVYFGPSVARVVAITFAVLAALAHLLIVFGELPAWVRVASGLLAAVHGYVVVLLLTRPAREYFGGVAP